MDPHNSQQPYHQQWQMPPASQPQRGSWADPRFRPESTPAYGTPVPAFQPGSYNPSQYGHISGQSISAYSVPPPPQTSIPPPQPSSTPLNVPNWGVPYNQGYQDAQHSAALHGYSLGPPPMLPPRPGSALGTASHPDMTWETQPTSYEESWPNPSLGASQIPPIPPPRPPQYMTQARPPQNVFPHEQYSQQPPTHRYEPPSANQWATQQNVAQNQTVTPSQQWHQSGQSFDGTISPVSDLGRHNSTGGLPSAVSPVPTPSYPSVPQQHRLDRAELPGFHTGVSALGWGGPSDWQHYNDESSHAAHGGSPEITPTRLEPEKSHVVSAHSSTGDRTQADCNHVTFPTFHPPRQQISAPDQNQQNGNQANTSESSNKPRLTDAIDAGISQRVYPFYEPTGEHPALEPQELPADGPGPKSREKPPSHSSARVDGTTQTDFEPYVKTESSVETVIEIKEVNPFDDIKDHYAATLKRFASMLRQEAAEDADEDKFKVFQGFVIRELRLRSVLYGVETDAVQDSDNHLGNKPRFAPKTSSEDRHQESERKLASALDVPKETAAIDGKSQSPRQEDKSNSSQFCEHDHPTDAPESNAGKAGLSIVLPDSEKPTLTGLSQNAANPSPAANAPMTLDDYIMPDPKSSDDSTKLTHPHASSGLVTHPARTAATLAGPINFQPPRPAYAPFRYQQNYDHLTPLAASENRSSDSYRELRQSHTAGSGRLLASEALPSIPADRATTQTPMGGRQEHQEAFIGLIRRQSKAIREKTPALSEAPAPLRAGTPYVKSSLASAVPTSPLAHAVKALAYRVDRSLLLPKKSTHRLPVVLQELRAVSDDFTFIHATVVAWDKENRMIRQNLESERSIRQSENETRVDMLFNDNEIGYADIGDLEKDFKLEEATKRYHEDRLELESFIKDVFEVVTNNVQGQLSTLNKLYTRARDLLDLHSESVGQSVILYFEDNTDHSTESMERVMNVMLEIFNKIELRHQKLAEAQFERERRRKHLELSVLYTNGDKEGVKKLESDFSRAENLQILDEARRKDERANKLIDAFDRAVVRGLAENQGWQDDVSTKVQLIRDIVFGSEQNMPIDPQEKTHLLHGTAGKGGLCDDAGSMIRHILTDSQQMIRLNNTADKLLNEADYAMYVAEERLAGGGVENLTKLKQDKLLEDTKLHEDFEARLTGVALTPDETLGLVREVVEKLEGDGGHKERIAKALEEAKRRNTITTPAPNITNS